MWTSAINLLADATDPVWKVGFGIIVFILWGIGALASAVRRQKQQERLRQQQMWTEVEREMAGRRDSAMARRGGPDVRGAATPPFAVPIPVPPPPPPPPLMTTRVPPEWTMPPGPAVQPPPVPVPAPQRVQRRGKAKAARRGRQADVAPAMPAQVVQSTLESIQAHRSAAPAASAGQQATASANAAALHRWLSARTMRSQFILTEILQPPLALREPRRL
jgi:hypothetical protein